MTTPGKPDTTRTRKLRTDIKHRAAGPAATQPGLTSGVVDAPMIVGSARGLQAKIVAKIVTRKDRSGGQFGRALALLVTVTNARIH